MRKPIWIHVYLMCLFVSLPKYSMPVATSSPFSTSRNISVFVWMLIGWHTKHISKIQRAMPVNPALEVGRLDLLKQLGLTTKNAPPCWRDDNDPSVKQRQLRMAKQSVQTGLRHSDISTFFFVTSFFYFCLRRVCK
jgi:hypothetical protein